MTTPKVYVTQEVTHASYSDLERFGLPIFMTASEISSTEYSLHNQRLVSILRERLTHFDPDTDFIAPSGSPIITGLVFALVSEKTDVFRILKWNNRDRIYTKLTIGIKGATWNNPQLTT